MLKDISYKDYKRSDDVHGTVLYPAVMVAPVQKDVLLDLRQEDPSISSIFDPFHGSGTSLYESCVVFQDIQVYGCDINPLANLITRTKLEGVSSEISEDIEEINHILKTDKCTDIYEFPNRAKWFRDDIAISLTKIRRAIMQIGSEENRHFFWCMMSDVVRRYCNSRSSTYKLHIKLQRVIDGMQDHAIEDFLQSIQSNYKKFEIVHYNKARLYKQDLLDCLQQFQKHQVDILITSPPYGDNNTTVPYGLFSSLALKWIDPHDLELEGWELDSYSAIDNHSLGNGHTPQTLTRAQEELLSPYLSAISEAKTAKVRRFFHAYFECLDRFANITNKYIVLTLGNRTVDRVRIDLADVSGKYLVSKGFLEHQTASRTIQNKRIPRLVSKVNDAPVESMSKEYVLIYKRAV